MKTKYEIMEYLMVLSRNIDNIDDILKDANKVEEKYKNEIENEGYEYALYSDFINSPFILEDEDLVSELKKIDQIGGIVIYKPIFNDFKKEYLL